MNVKRIIANLTVHLKQFSREKSTIFFVLLFPILLMVLFGFIFADMGNTVYTMPVQNYDDGYWSHELLDSLNSTGVFDIQQVDLSEDPATYMNDTNNNFILVIPEGFSDQINATETIYDYLGNAATATSQALNYSLMALEGSGDSMAYNQESLNYSTEAMGYLVDATSYGNPNTISSTLEALESTGNALNYTGLSLAENGDTLNNTALAVQELGKALNYTLEAMTYQIEPNAALNLTIYYDDTDSLAQTMVQILSSIIDGFNKGLSGAKDVIGVESNSVNPEKFEFIDFFAPGIIAMSVMTTSLFGTVGMNTELRQKGILRKLATTPLTRSEWLISNIFYQLFMSLLSTACILIVGYLGFGLQPYINVFMFVFITLNVFAFSGIGMLITRYVKEAESAQAAANAVMFPMMFLSGTFFQMEMMPGFLQAIAKILPLYYVNEGLRASMISLDMGVILESAIVIGVFGLGVFILGVLLTSWKDD